MEYWKIRKWLVYLSIVFCATYTRFWQKFLHHARSIKYPTKSKLKCHVEGKIHSRIEVFEYLDMLFLTNYENLS